MAIKSAKDVIEIAKARGFAFRVDPGPPPMPVLVKPPNVPKEEASPVLMEALRAWRLEIIEELQGVTP